MQVITEAGIAWLDLDPEYLTVYGSDWFEFRKNGWRIEHRSGIYLYKERADGLAILNVLGVHLPEMVCSRFAGSLERLENLIEIDPACVARKCEGKITSATNKNDGSVDISLRVKWVDTATRQLPQWTRYTLR